MVIKSFTACFMLVVFSFAALCQEGTRIPQGPAPRLLVIHSVNKEAKEVHYFDFKKEMRVGRKEVTETSVTGQQKKVVYEYVEEVDHPVIVPMQIRDAQFFDATGIKISGQKALERLESGAVVLMATNGKMVDSAYLRSVRPETLIIVPPASSNPENDGPKKAPAPSSIRDSI